MNIEILGIPFYHIVCYFIIYSLVGYICEVIYAALVTGKFVNRGFLSGPYCPIYGFGIVIAVLLLTPLKESLFLLFSASAVLCSLLEYFSGFVLEKLFHQKWWDYSGKPFNLCGYVCLQNSILWGIGCVLILKLVMPATDRVIDFIPMPVGLVIGGTVSVVMIIDLAATIMSILHMNKRLKALNDISEKIRYGSDKIGGVISSETLGLKDKYEASDLKEKVESSEIKLREGYEALLTKNSINVKRLVRAFPSSNSDKYRETYNKLKEKLREVGAGYKDKLDKIDNYVESENLSQSMGFAHGLCYTKIFWLFFIGGITGFVIETIWCLLVTKHYEMRTGFVYGFFIPVYGMGAVIITLALYRLSKKRDLWIFVGSAFIGGAFEYFCSLFQELMFGTVSWEYSNTPLNVGGRTNLMFALFWGILGLVWVKDLYPHISAWIEKIPPKPGKILTAALSVLIVWNIFISSAAVLRWNDRRAGIPAENVFEVWMDKNLNDDYMTFIYPNMVPFDQKGTNSTDIFGTQKTNRVS